MFVYASSIKVSSLFATKKPFTKYAPACTFTELAKPVALDVVGNEVDDDGLKLMSLKDAEKLLIKKALQFNKNILELTEKDAIKYIFSKYNNSPEAFRNFLDKNDLSKSVVISNVQIEIIKKYLIGKMFEKEYDDYIKEISNNSENKIDEIDLEQIIIKINNKNIELINSIDDRINFLSNKGYSFKEISNILSKNNKTRAKDLWFPPIRTL